MLAVTLWILLFSNAVAKEADVPVNMLFSRNVKFAEMGQLEVVKADKISRYVNILKTINMYCDVK